MNDTLTTAARSVHDLGAAAWFGGSLMGAVGVNKAAAATAKNKESTAVAGAGWSAWTPINLAAIGAYVAGGSVLTLANRGRLETQRGVRAASVVKTVLTATALATTGYARYIGQRVIDAEGDSAQDGTTPSSSTSDGVAHAQRQLAVLQWVIPAATAGIVVTSAVMGEQQRPKHVLAGILGKAGSKLPL